MVDSKNPTHQSQEYNPVFIKFSTHTFKNWVFLMIKKQQWGVYVAFLIISGTKGVLKLNALCHDQAHTTPRFVSVMFPGRPGCSELSIANSAWSQKSFLQLRKASRGHISALWIWSCTDCWAQCECSPAGKCEGGGTVPGVCAPWWDAIGMMHFVGWLPQQKVNTIFGLL